MHDSTKGPYTNIDISWINAKFGTTADWLLKHIINNATYFKNFVAMKRRDNLNCCKNIKTKWPQNSWNRLRWVNSCDSGIDPRSRIFTKMIFLLLEISLYAAIQIPVIIATLQWKQNTQPCRKMKNICILQSSIYR